MATVNTARRHGDYPLEVRGEFVPRVQNFELTKNVPMQTVDEMGNFSHAGASQDPAQYTASITWFPINNALELLTRGLASSAGSSLTLADWIGLENGVTLKNLKASLSGARVVGLEYSTQAPSGEFRGTMRLKGTGWTDEANTITVTAPSGVGAYKAKDVGVALNGTDAKRCAGISVRVDFPNQELYELHNANPVGTSFDSPTLTCDVDFYESDVIAGNTEFALTSPGSIVVHVGEPAVKTITCGNMVWNQKAERGTVRGYATRRYSYTSTGSATTYGMTIA